MLDWLPANFIMIQTYSTDRADTTARDLINALSTLAPVSPCNPLCNYNQVVIEHIDTIFSCDAPTT